MYIVSLDFQLVNTLSQIHHRTALTSDFCLPTTVICLLTSE